MDRAPLPSAARRGITLMEVLISIGILAIGLTSVVALVPAGRSQAARGIVLDRAATVGANALADAITAGFTRFDSLTPVSEDYDENGTLDVNLGEFDINGNDTADKYESLSEDFKLDGSDLAVDDRNGNGLVENFGFVICDPLGPMYVEGPFPNVGRLPVLHVAIKQRGALSPPSRNPRPQPGDPQPIPLPGTGRWVCPFPGVGGATTRMELITRGRDDVAFDVGNAGTDDPPLNRLDAAGVRSFEGRTTCLFALARMDTTPYSTPRVSPPLLPGELAKLSAVVFHNRTGDASEALVPAEFAADGSLTVRGIDLPTGRTIKDLIKPGVVIYDGKKVYASNQHERFALVTMASVESQPDATGAHKVYVSFAGATPMPGTVQILVDSVGLAEQTVVLEGAGAYGR